MKRRRPRPRAQPLGYAKRLRPTTNHRRGLCGDEVPEEVDTDLEWKIEELARALWSANYVVAHTGAGISTASGIPDFRGKRGIWTMAKEGKPLPDYEKCWNNALPTLSHMALRGLMDAKILQYVVSQNIDGLHLRSGIPRERVSELHGNMFAQRCDTCSHEVIGTMDVGGIGCNPTEFTCPKCDGRMYDRLLDWETPLPEPDFERAQVEAAKCAKKWDDAICPQRGQGGGLALCLGTSLQMVPANKLPFEAGRAVIINLQPTQWDEDAYLVLRGRTDDVMRAVMERLRTPIPPYERVETLTLAHELAVKHRHFRSSGTCRLNSIVRIKVGDTSTLGDGLSGLVASVLVEMERKASENDGEEGLRRVREPLDTLPFMLMEPFEEEISKEECCVCVKAKQQGPRPKEGEQQKAALSTISTLPTASTTCSLTETAKPHEVPERAVSAAGTRCSTTILSNNNGRCRPLTLRLTVNFEPVPAITAGAGYMEAFIPEPIVREYHLDLSRAQRWHVEKVPKVLTRVDFEALYQSPPDVGMVNDTEAGGQERKKKGEVNEERSERRRKRDERGVYDGIQRLEGRELDLNQRQGISTVLSVHGEDERTGALLHLGNDGINASRDKHSLGDGYNDPEEACGDVAERWNDSKWV